MHFSRQPIFSQATLGPSFLMRKHEAEESTLWMEAGSCIAWAGPAQSLEDEKTDLLSALCAENLTHSQLTFTATLKDRKYSPQPA